ncbi:MAG: hypothetical protein H6667_11210 [Ardenticatenaceae bacterium]|nr:hypothetical protein [Ardenticatenaceae bacterium]
MLKNGSFTEGWTDLSPAPGFLINQQPNGWILNWIEPGESLFGAGDVAKGVPECVHKLAKQLPPNEQPGGPDALILVGGTTYKIFHANSAFGAQLSQKVTGLKPGSTATLVVPVLAVLYNETDPYGAESGLWINGEGEWVHSGKMGNRKWYRHEVTFTVPDDGTAVIEIRVKSKWMRPKDFFIDGITLEATAVTTPPPTIGEPPTEPPFEPPTQPAADTLQIRVPEGIKLVTAVSNEPGVVVIVLPPGLKTDIQ